MRRVSVAIGISRAPIRITTTFRGRVSSPQPRDYLLGLTKAGWPGSLPHHCPGAFPRGMAGRGHHQPFAASGCSLLAPALARPLAGLNGE
jgi:hypothetical protein